MKPYFIFLAAILLLSACTTSQPIQKTPINPETLAGIYHGLLPCEGCPGIDVDLELKADFTFVETSTFQERDVRPITVYGKWNAEKNLLQLHYSDRSENLLIENSKLFKLEKENKKLATLQPGFFVFEPKKESQNSIEPTLNGKWVLLTLNGKTYTNPRDINRKPYIEFSTNELRISGNTGCNNFNGNFAMEENRLKIGPTLAMTKMGCLDTFESQFIDALVAIDSYQFFTQKLILFTKGKQVFVFERISKTE